MSTRSTRETIDPGVQAIFDAMFSYMTAQNAPTCNSWANRTGNGMSYGISTTAYDGSQVSHTYFTPGSKVTVTPSNATLGPAGTQQFSAIATDAGGVDIAGATFTWKVEAGSAGSIDATGLYTAPATIAAQMVAVVTAMLSDQTAWASVTVTLMP